MFIVLSRISSAIQFIFDHVDFIVFIAVERLQPTRRITFLPIKDDFSEIKVAEIASSLRFGVGLIITAFNSVHLVKSLVSKLKPGSHVNWQPNVSEDICLMICKELQPGVILELTHGRMSLPMAQKILDTLSPQVHISLPTDSNVSFRPEIRNVFVQRDEQSHRVRFSNEPNIRFSLFSHVPTPHKCNQEDIVKIKTFILFELGESGSFYNGLISLEREDRAEVLDYLIGKYSRANYSNPSATALEYIIEQLDGGVGFFNNLQVSVDKVARYAILKAEHWVEITSFVVEQLQELKNTPNVLRI